MSVNPIKFATAGTANPNNERRWLVPSKVLPSPEDFAWLTQELVGWGFRPITDTEFRGDFRRLRLKAPRLREGREVGFVFTANELTVKVWTTWLSEGMRARDIDEAWVLIVKGDRPLYFSHPVHRTKGFLRKLSALAWLTRERVICRPHCPKCGHFMTITPGRGIKSRYWRCDRVMTHGDRLPADCGWDDPLSFEGQLLARNLRRTRQSYEKNRREEGKPLHTALKKRKPWQRAF